MRATTFARAATALLVLLTALVLLPTRASAQQPPGNPGRAAPEPPASASPDLPTPPTAPILSDVLDATTQGADALAALTDAELADVAVQNGQTVDSMTEILAEDATAYLDPDGVLLYQDPVLSPEEQAAPTPEPGPFPNSSTFFLHSRPGSARTLYLDFDGYSLPAGTGWRSGAAYNALPWDTNGNGATWSQSEHDTIQSVWQRVSEDYAAWDIDVTTQDPGYAAINRSSAADNVYGTRVVITDSPNSDFCSCGGVAFVGVIDFTGANHDFYQPAWAFASGVGDGAHNLAEVSSHEAGHNIGLSHDGQSPSTAYYAGHGMWAPVMGNSYNQPVTQWSRGEYTSANNLEDDYAVAAANGVTLIPDEAGCAVAATDSLVQNARRLIASEGDCDAFRYIAPCSGTFTVITDAAPTSPNLSVQMNLWNWNSTFISNHQVQPVEVTSDLATGMGEVATVAMTAGASYTIAVFPLPNGTGATGFTNFGNRGEYRVRVATPCGADAFGANSIGGPFDTRSANNASYSTEAGEPNPTCGDTSTGSTNTAWWNWTAPANGTVTFDTGGSSFDTVLAVYTGAAVGSLSQVACNDDAIGLQSSVTMAVTSGVTYRVQVDGFGAATGNIVLNTRGCVPVNNNTFGCANTLTTTATGSNVGYSAEGGEPSAACGSPAPLQSAWWNWTAPGNGSFTINTNGSNFDTILGVYTGSAVNGLAAVTCNDDFGGVQSSVTFNAVAGTTYRIQVDGYLGATGNISLNVVDNRPLVRPFAVGAAEGDVGTQVVHVPVFLEDAAGNPVTTSSPVTVNWSTMDIPSNPNVAISGADYVAASGVATIPAGASSTTVPITIINDTLVEPPLLYGEWLLIQFSGVSNNARLNFSFFGLGLVIIGDDAGG
jgi:hypothetical protein